MIQIRGGFGSLFMRIMVTGLINETPSQIWEGDLFLFATAWASFFVSVSLELLTADGCALRRAGNCGCACVKCLAANETYFFRLYPVISVTVG